MVLTTSCFGDPPNKPDIRAANYRCSEARVVELVRNALRS